MKTVTISFPRKTYYVDVRGESEFWVVGDFCNEGFAVYSTNDRGLANHLADALNSRDMLLPSNLKDCPIPYYV